jgi:hypothetical protein
MNDNTNNYLNNLYTYLNNNQYYMAYNTSVQSQSSNAGTEVNQSVYEKLLHDFRNHPT